MFDLRTYTEMFRIFTIIYINTPLSERADKGLCIIKKGSLCAHFKPFSPARYPPRFTQFVCTVSLAYISDSTTLIKRLTFSTEDSFPSHIQSTLILITFILFCFQRKKLTGFNGNSYGNNNQVYVSKL